MNGKKLLAGGLILCVCGVIYMESLDMINPHQYHTAENSSYVLIDNLNIGTINGTVTASGVSLSTVNFSK